MIDPIKTEPQQITSIDNADLRAQLNIQEEHILNQQIKIDELLKMFSDDKKEQAELEKLKREREHKQKLERSRIRKEKEQKLREQEEKHKKHEHERILKELELQKQRDLEQKRLLEQQQLRDAQKRIERLG